MEIYKCVRCGHEWASRKLSRPDRCAGCTRPNWWRAVRIARIRPDAVRPVGKPCKYAVHLLNIGQQMTFPYEGLNVVSAKNSMLRRAKRLGFVLEFKTSGAGLTVTRVL